ncbi:unnamed protein product [Nippostrongylus brasiliensis]|uniref:Uncharacterized protein n=1 Tax=Nippostrongylus brasiliensis TaxID=27835 RepID=A0A0N4Y6E4_NIPBR|nr:unnamed protein product [Nippostrongylus brasiliensis]
MLGAVRVVDVVGEDVGRVLAVVVVDTVLGDDELVDQDLLAVAWVVVIHQGLVQDSEVGGVVAALERVLLGVLGIFWVVVIHRGLVHDSDELDGAWVVEVVVIHHGTVQGAVVGAEGLVLELGIAVGLVSGWA